MFYVNFPFENKNKYNENYLFILTNKKPETYWVKKIFVQDFVQL